MRSIISVITAAALALHFGLGCCAHHVHADDACVDHAHAEPHSHQHGSQPAGTESTGRDSHDHSDGPRKCDEGSCVSTTRAKSSLAEQLSSAWLALYGLDVAVQRVATPERMSLSELADPPPLPVRLHLWHQHFLI